MSLDCSSASVIVAGDVMLDRYWFGDSTRISPEAPVPVVRVQRTGDVAGGAANVAINAVNLGAHVSLLSVVGDDQDGRALQALLESRNVRCTFLRDAALQTTVKLRVISRNQQIVRADFEQRPNHELLFPLVAQFREKLKACKTVVFSDYGKGGLAHLRLMMSDATSAGATILVDPKGPDYSIYRGATVVTPNRDEFAQAAGKWTSEADFERRAFGLRDRFELAALLVTRSEEGMSLFVEHRHIRIAAQAREVYDVSGAGDTVIATMASALAAGHDVESAARFANVAAGIVVGKIGTAPITLDELNQRV